MNEETLLTRRRAGHLQELELPVGTQVGVVVADRHTLHLAHVLVTADGDRAISGTSVVATHRLYPPFQINLLGFDPNMNIM